MLLFSFTFSFVCLFVFFKIKASAVDKLEQYGVSLGLVGRWFQPKWRMKAVCLFVCLFVVFTCSLASLQTILAGDKLEQYGVSLGLVGRGFQPKWRMKAAVRQAFQ